jgi:hypothetical protein
MGRRVRHVIHNVANAGAQVALLGSVGVSGSPVDTWTGLRGTSINATGSGTARPTTTTLNGQPALLFDGVNDNLQFGGYTQPSVNFLYFYVCQPNTTHEIDAEGTSGFPGTSGQKYLSYGISDPGSTSIVSVGTNGVSIYEHAPSHMPARRVLSGAIGTSVIEQVCASNAHSIGVNGVFTAPIGGSIRTPVYGSSQLGAFGYQSIQGPIAAAVATNQVWSAAVAKRIRHALAILHKIPCS